MKELTALLDQASFAYYQQAHEIMSDHEYDALYDELVRLEAETGVVLSGSPTRKVGYQVMSALPKVSHASPMLSLDKTKSREALRDWLGGQVGELSWKMDGLTVVLTYQDGTLMQAVTRGNGEVGEEITANAACFVGLPLRIPFRGRLVLRGEAVISYRDFEELNSRLPAEEQYKNPRNLCSGSVRQLNSRVTAERRVHCILYTLVSSEPAEGEELMDAASKMGGLEQLRRMGFEVVEYRRVTADTLLDAVEAFEASIADQAYPSDGLVLTYDDIAYSAGLGRTAKFPRDSIAFKWADETAETTLLDVEWQTSRTGLINPVALFEPVELEGTTVQRASVHNVSMIRELQLGIGDRILVYKANMIIPQISENLTRSGTLPIPEACPRCGAPTREVRNYEASVLTCTNPACPAKIHQAFVHFTSRASMNIEGLSEATLDRFIEAGFLSEYPDLYHLSEHRDEIRAMEGFGEKSADKLLASIEASRETEAYRLIASLGIPGVGAANARVLMRAFGQDVRALMNASVQEIAAVEGFAELGATKIVDFFANPLNRRITEALLEELHFRQDTEQPQEDSPLNGKTVVITGSLEHFANRERLAELIAAGGGKVSGSVSAKTAWLINNDITSTSGKNKKAHELGIPIISEQDFLQLSGITPDR
ncbi:MAG: NAD-dependent DNA ligase LigA [Firmicutes bacterium]|nr:NAD-dependent DNA ligase LigA [Bacillota bacterium]